MRRPGSFAFVTTSLITAGIVLACAGPSTPTVPAIGSEPALVTPRAAPSAATEPSSHESGEPTPGGLTQTGSTDPASAYPQYAACLRAHGVPINDPVVDSKGRPNWPNAADVAALESISTAVDSACQPIIANLPGLSKIPQALSPEELGPMLHFSQCMRDHGVPNYPDPDSYGHIDVTMAGIVRTDLTILAAGKACQAVFDGG